MSSNLDLIVSIAASIMALGGFFAIACIASSYDGNDKEV